MRPHLMWLATLLLGCGSVQDENVLTNQEQSTESEPDDDYPSLDLPTFTEDPGRNDGNQDEDSSKAIRDQGSSLNVLYLPEPLIWYEADAHVPHGYHLPSRAEIIAAIDAGWFVKSAQTIGSVWSSTSVREAHDRAYRVNLVDGWMQEVGKGSAMPVIYFRNENQN